MRVRARDRLPGPLIQFGYPNPRVHLGGAFAAPVFEVNRWAVATNLLPSRLIVLLELLLYSPVVPTPHSAAAFAKLTATRNRLNNVSRQLDELKQGDRAFTARYYELQTEWDAAFLEFEAATREFSAAVEQLHGEVEARNKTEQTTG